MAIYHLHMKYHSRKQGKSSVGCSAYRRGERLTDNRIGRTWDYTGREDVIYSKFHILGNSPSWLNEIVALERTNPQKAAERFWNLVEVAEKRKDAKLAYDIDVALPLELSKEQNVELLNEFVASELCARGMVVDVNIHWKDGNPHAHLQGSTREILESGFGNKVIAWEQKKFVYDVRKAWANHTNMHLSLHKKGVKIDHRSFQDQGIRFAPTAHVGFYGDKLYEQGLSSRIVHENVETAIKNVQIAFEHPEEILKEVAAQRAVFSQENIMAIANKRLNYNEELLESIKPKLLQNELIRAVGEDVRGNIKYATVSYIEAEKGLFEVANHLKEGKRHGLNSNKVNQLIDVKYNFLSAEQRKAILHCCSKEGISCVVGKAGTGKTTLMKAVSEAYKEEGYRVIGMGLAGKAAENLGREVNIEAKTIMAYIKTWESYDNALDKHESIINPKEKAYNAALISSLRSYQLGHKDVVIIDEAGMIGTEQYHTVLQRVQEAGAKAISLGDYHQLPAIAAGDAYRGIVDVVGAIDIRQIRRQKHKWMIKASELFSELNVRDGLDAYNNANRLKWSSTDSVMIAEIVKDYFVGLDENQKTTKDLAINNQLVLAYTNDYVDRINSSIREELKSRKLIGKLTTTIKDKEYVIGERIVFLENDNKGKYIETISGEGKGIKNGELGTIIGIDEFEITVKLDSKRVVVVDIEEYTKFQYGYAVTAHKAQGATIDRTYVALSTHMDAQATYVAMTRHREDVKAYISQEHFRDYSHLVHTIGRVEQKELVTDYQISEANKLYYENVKQYINLAQNASELLNEIKERSLKEDQEIWQDEAWKQFMEIKAQRNSLAASVIDNWVKHKTFARQAGLSKEYLEVQVGRRKRILTSIEEQAKRTMEEYKEVLFNTRNLWNEIKATHPANLCYSHSKYELFDNLRQDRDSLAYTMTQNTSVHRQFCKELATKWQTINIQAQAFEKKAIAKSEYKQLTKEEQKRYHLVEEYKEFNKTCGSLWSLIKNHKTKSMVINNSKLTCLDAWQEANEARNDRAYKIVQNIKSNQQFLDWHDIKINNLYKHADSHQEQKLVDNYVKEENHERDFIILKKFTAKKEMSVTIDQEIKQSVRNLVQKIDNKKMANKYWLKTHELLKDVKKTLGTTALINNKELSDWSLELRGQIKHTAYQLYQNKELFASIEGKVGKHIKYKALEYKQQLTPALKQSFKRTYKMTFDLKDNEK